MGWTSLHGLLLLVAESVITALLKRFHKKFSQVVTKQLEGILAPDEQILKSADSGGMSVLFFTNLRILLAFPVSIFHSAKGGAFLQISYDSIVSFRHLFKKLWLFPAYKQSVKLKVQNYYIIYLILKISKPDFDEINQFREGLIAEPDLATWRFLGKGIKYICYNCLKVSEPGSARCPFCQKPRKIWFTLSVRKKKM